MSHCPPLFLSLSCKVGLGEGQARLTCSPLLLLLLLSLCIFPTPGGGGGDNRQAEWSIESGKTTMLWAWPSQEGRGCRPRSKKRKRAREEHRQQPLAQHRDCHCPRYCSAKASKKRESESWLAFNQHQECHCFPSHCRKPHRSARCPKRRFHRLHHQVA